MPSQLSAVCTWKIFLAWSLVNNCLERGHKNCFGPWRKMIRNSGRCEKLWDSFMFWELISWKSHSLGSSGYGKEVCSTYATSSGSFYCLHIFVFFRMSYSWSHTAFSDWLLPLKNMHVSFPHVWFPELIAHLFSVLNNDQLCGCTTIYLLIHWRMFGHFQVGNCE